MKIKTFYLTIKVVFGSIFVLHLLRLIFGWRVAISGAVIPVWVSWLAVFLVGFLLYQAHKLTKAL